MNNIYNLNEVYKDWKNLGIENLDFFVNNLECKEGSDTFLSYLEENLVPLDFEWP